MHFPGDCFGHQVSRQTIPGFIHAANQEKAMVRFAQGGFHVTYEKRVDLDALHKKRVLRADEQRRKAGLDALLVWKDENCRYLTDLRPQLIAGKSTALNGALLIDGKAPIL